MLLPRVIIHINAAGAILPSIEIKITYITDEIYI